MFLLGLFVGMLFEFLNWFFLAPAIEKRKRDKLLAYLPYDKCCREECDAFKICYEVNCELRRADRHGDDDN